MYEQTVSIWTGERNEQNIKPVQLCLLFGKNVYI